MKQIKLLRWLLWLITVGGIHGTEKTAATTLAISASSTTTRLKAVQQYCSVSMTTLRPWVRKQGAASQAQRAVHAEGKAASRGHWDMRQTCCARWQRTGLEASSCRFKELVGTHPLHYRIQSNREIKVLPFLKLQVTKGWRNHFH